MINCFKMKIKQIFYISYVLMLFSWMFESVLYIKEILPFVRYFSYILALIVVFYNYKNFSLIKFMINITVTILVVISTIHSKSNLILSLWLFVLACEKVDFEELVRIDFKTKSVFVIMIFILYLLGLTQQTQFMSYTGEIRNALGFTKPNTFGYYVFSICADYIYIKTGKFSFLNSMVLFVISLFVGSVSLSRTSAYLIILLTIIASISIFFKKIVFNKFSKKIISLSFIIFTIFSLLIAINYDNGNKLHNKLNSLTSGRIVISQKYLNKYDFKIFGQDTEVKDYTGNNELYLDNAYLKLLINNGIFVYLLMLYIYMRIIKHGYEKKNNLLIMIVLVYLVYGITENAMFWLTGNVYLLYCFCEKNSIRKEQL